MTLDKGQARAEWAHRLNSSLSPLVEVSVGLQGVENNTCFQQVGLLSRGMTELT